ncbi:hypothetical protein PC9H_009332 [Pleurotus ostreatus]|uniref:C2H2-type domain-containing protein n=1 Tax=Pleurotus ostreatus TaxID=5322 RepID=A0A8H7DPI6_PLEOS|nr:uncharacterized protein PC9H_009332 [Pleurotus ostreatus]KAF7424032.1 hypothetical protein PC9H_009332 [Pleurotus ostreatus]
MPGCHRCPTDPLMLFHRCAGWPSPYTNSSDNIMQNNGSTPTSPTGRSQGQGYPYTPNLPHNQPGQYMPNQLPYQIPASPMSLNGYNSGSGLNSGLTVPIHTSNGQEHYKHAGRLSHPVPSESRATSFSQHPSLLPPALPGPIVRDVVGSEAMTYAANLRRQTSARFYCPHCPSSFTARHNHRNHILAHSGQRPFRCDVCNASFTTSGDLRRHKRTRRHAQMLQC